MPITPAMTDAHQAASYLVVDCVNALLYGARAFHVRHLQCRKHAEHVVLGEVYALCTDNADRIAETARGMGFDVSGLSDRTGPYDWNEGTNSVVAVTALASYVDQLRQRLPQHLAIVTPLIDAVCALRQKVALLSMATLET